MEYGIEYNSTTQNYDITFDDGCIWTAANYSEAEETALAYIATLEIQTQARQQQVAQVNIFDTPAFIDAVEVAKSAVKDRVDADKWTKAIDRAVEMAHDPAYTTTPMEWGLLIVKSDGTEYHANGHCNCQAFQRGLTHCKHRVLNGLVKKVRN